jgi:hypothetical protein
MQRAGGVRGVCIGVSWGGLEVAAPQSDKKKRGVGMIASPGVPPTTPNTPTRYKWG